METDQTVTIVTVSGNGVVEPLAPAEKDRLRILEGIITQNLLGFMAAGTALREIQEAKLYREGYATFRVYCEERWGIKDSRARQLILATETAEAVAPAVLDNEWAARTLRRFPEPLRPAIAQIAVAQAGTYQVPLTSRMIERVGEVIYQAAVTGSISLDGESIALDAVLTEEQVEALQRQREKIAEAAEKRKKSPRQILMLAMERADLPLEQVADVLRAFYEETTDRALLSEMVTAGDNPDHEYDFEVVTWGTVGHVMDDESGVYNLAVWLEEPDNKTVSLQHGQKVKAILQIRESK